MLPTKLAFVDIETTGGRSAYDRIIEIGIVRVKEDELVDTYSTLINPGIHIPQEIVGITGITTSDVQNAPSFREVAPEIITRLKDYIFVAHNVRFDYGFVKNEFARLGYTFTSRHFCTVRLSRLLYPTSPRHNLDTIIERHNIPCKNRHRALDDARVLFSFYSQAKSSHPEQVFTHALESVLKKPYLPIKLSAEAIDALPETPGVYIFYGPQPENEKKDNRDRKMRSIPHIPLYIGKSINIKERVLSHFSGDVHSPLEMKIAQQVESIETIVTAGELGALFRESELIKTMLPLYNRMLRQKKELIALIQKTTNDGYLSTELTTITSPDPTNLPAILGLFKSQKQAKEYLTQLAKEFILCEKLLGLEKTKTACFAHRLERCKGACIAEEPAMSYNIRFMTALGERKIKNWPFPGPIIIQEKNDITGMSESFIVDKWCLLRNITEDAFGSYDDKQYTYSFDLDTYKILLRFLQSQEHLKNIRQLPNSQHVILD